MRRFLLIAAVFAVVLLYGLTVATGSSSVLSDYFLVDCCFVRLAVAGVGGGIGALCRAFDARQQQKRVRFADWRVGCRGCLPWLPYCRACFCSVFPLSLLTVRLILGLATIPMRLWSAV